MTIGTIILLGCIGWIICLHPSLNKLFINFTALAIALEVMISVGAFLNFGSFDIGFSELVIFLDIVIALLLLTKSRIKRKVMLYGILLLVAACFSFALQIIYPYKGIVVPDSASWDLYYFGGVIPGNIVIGINQIKEIIHLICYIFIFQQVKCLKEDDQLDILHKTFVYQVPFIYFSLFEIVFVKILRKETLVNSIIKFMVGNQYLNEAGVTSLGVTNRLKGLKSEPSMYGFALFIFILLCISLYNELGRKKYLYYGVFAFVVMLLSLSFTAIVCAFILIAFAVLKYFLNLDKKKKCDFIVLVIIALIFFGVCIYYIYTHQFSNYYLKRMHMALINFDDLSMDGWAGNYVDYDGSTKIRLISIVGSLKYFFARPFWGLALGSTYAHSTMATVMASIGIIGTFIWWKFTFETVYVKKRRFYIILTIIWCTCLLILDNGLFPFYGVENIIIVHFFEKFSEKIVWRKKNG